MNKYHVKAYDKEQRVVAENNYLADSGGEAIEQFEHEFSERVEGLLIIAETREYFERSDK